MGFLSTYLFSGNVSLLNLSFLNAIHWPHLLVISGDVDAVARTVFLAGVVTVQIGNAFACRTSKAHTTQMGWGSNKTLLGGIILSLLLIAGLVYVPPLAEAFDNQIFPFILWPALLLYALVLYTMEWFRKRLIRWTEKNQENRPSNSDERR
jgi:magnesium-transporting ATPase (P-type)